MLSILFSELIVASHSYNGVYLLGMPSYITGTARVGVSCRVLTIDLLLHGLRLVANWYRLFCIIFFIFKKIILISSNKSF